ncbi:peptidase S41 [Actinomadura sp. NBRC 104412]|uniref:S41 family peptidase n=1 Tax=Actinomadura sp. NBRC 104412 TaxID=3032203 RepID=UPI0024A57103|nr:S41 family peptidase [Actinomadura sp. NBRC 104412]GLZ03831.1 peptidase S41 [Actinomadura sp. NBRC 104412]
MFRLSGRGPRAGAIAIALVCAYAVGTISAGERRSANAARPVPKDGTAARLEAFLAASPGRNAPSPAAIESMLRRLGDRWARYYSPSEYEEFRGRLDGRYSGVGLWLAGEDVQEGTAREGTGWPHAKAHAVLVAGVRPSSAAERAGVRGGDAIVAVGGRPVAGWDPSQVAMALRGRPGTRVELTVARDGAERRFQLVREAVRTGDVSVTSVDGRTRTIRVDAFSRGVGRQVRDAVTGRGHGVGGILLDLRGNPGGLLEEAVETASVFLSTGPVVTYERDGAAPRTLTVTRPGDPLTPLVVLVDGGTASAAEVVAGSLRDRDRAVIVGSRTFGKGTVQEPVELPDGSAVEVTVGRYRTPSGRNLEGAGIDPDVTVPADRPPGVVERRGRSVLRGLLATLRTHDGADGADRS